jgi:hypothetical protein
MKPAVCVLLLLALSPLAAMAAPQRVEVGRFSARDLDGWETKRFDAQTDYRLVPGEAGEVLRADSVASASGLFKKLRVDLAKTPVLHWSWRVKNLIQGADERSKGGDDYPARIYVVFSGGLLFWRTRAINYVWSSSQPVDSEWDNAYTGNAKMVAVAAGPDRLGEWVDEQRDVAQDCRRLFGEDPGPADAVAIMTDTDNTGRQATAWYGDIWFGEH